MIIIVIIGFIDHSHIVLIMGDLNGLCHLLEFADQIPTRSYRRNQYNMRMVYIAHFPLDQSAVAYYYYYPRQEIVTIVLLLLGGFAAGQAHTPSALDCNIPHNRQVPDTLWSKKQIEIKLFILPRDTNMLAVAGHELTTLMV